MKVKRDVLERIVREEFTFLVKKMLDEADVVAADDGEDDIEPADKSAPGGGEDAHMASKKKKEQPKKDDPELDDAPDEDELDDGDDEPDDDEDDDELDTMHAVRISADVPGKTIKSISVNQKSKMIPGAQEIVLSFEDDPEPLRIIVTETGTVRYVFHGIHEKV